MAAFALRREEGLGLGVAVVLHIALAAALLMQPAVQEMAEMPERVTVNLAEDVGLEAAAPDPVLESRAATAPEVSELPVPSPPQPQVIPQPPQPRATAAPRPVTRTTPRPRTTAAPTPRRTTAPSPRRTTAPQPRRTQAPTPAARPRASALGDNFLDGAGASITTQETRVPASQIGASARASLAQAVARQLRPHWTPVDGADREKLVSVVRWRLNQDGSLAGRPTLVKQTGITDANRAQAQRHGENAVRAVQLAAPFDLPDEYYEGWKYISAFSFDWKLSQ
ncbi:energy transducer TonB [Altererythrobacter sp.]|nr:energy transducer TonB [Altererythrobacter sp.]